MKSVKPNKSGIAKTRTSEVFNYLCIAYDFLYRREFGCEHSHKDIISILLDRGAKASSTDEEGCTPIHLAVMKEFTEGVEVLLEKRPKCVNYTDKQQRTPLHYAGKHCHKPEIIAILIAGYV